MGGGDIAYRRRLVLTQSARISISIFPEIPYRAGSLIGGVNALTSARRRRFITDQCTKQFEHVGRTTYRENDWKNNSYWIEDGQRNTGSTCVRAPARPHLPYAWSSVSYWVKTPPKSSNLPSTATTYPARPVSLPIRDRWPSIVPAPLCIPSTGFLVT